MALEVWPSSLPQDFNVSGFADSLADGLIKDEYNVGPPSYRRRTTAAPADFSGMMVLTTADWIALRTFFHTTLFDGALRFLFPPQATTDTGRYWITRFRAPPKRQLSDGDDLWFVTLEFERLGLGQVFVGPSLFSDADVIYPPSFIFDQIAAAARYDDADTFPTATIAGGALTATAAIYNDPDTFPAAVVTRSARIATAARYDDPDVFYTASVESAGLIVFQDNVFQEDVFQ